jgi:hypothetical protein
MPLPASLARTCAASVAAWYLVPLVVTVKFDPFPLNSVFAGPGRFGPADVPAAELDRSGGRAGHRRA